MLQTHFKKGLTLHKIEANEKFYKNFSTTKFIESVNLQIKKYSGRVTKWPNSNQR